MPVADIDLSANDPECESEVQVFTVNGPSINSNNMDGEEEVSMVESTWDRRKADRKFTFPKHSITMLRWKHT